MFAKVIGPSTPREEALHFCGEDMHSIERRSKIGRVIKVKHAAYSDNLLDVQTKVPYKREWLRFNKEETTIVDNTEEMDPKNEVMDLSTVARHPLLAHEESEYVEKVMEELELDHELGLNQQAQKDAIKVYKKDMDKLAEIHGYHEVSKEALIKLFGIRKLNMLARISNIREAITKTWDTWWMKFVCGSSAVIGIPFLVSLFSYMGPRIGKYNAYGATAGISLVVAACVIECIFIAGTFALQNKNSVSYDFMEVKLRIDEIKDAVIDLPLEPKRRAVKAKRICMFEKLVIAHPDFVTSRHNIESFYQKKMRRLDPAILGVSKDGRMFMVTWWDVQKDIDKTVTKISKFRKFKATVPHPDEVV